MKKLIIAAVLALTISANVQADVFEFCKQTEMYAEEIMKVRQSGVSASKAYSAAQNSKMLLSIVKAAYAKPAYDTPEYQEKAVSEFKDHYFTICYEELSK